MEPPVRFPDVGERLANRFRVVFGRGSGPNGTVFKALDLALDLPVAIKVFKPELFTSPYKDQNLLRMYRARAYQDPNLIKIFEVQEDRGFHFMSCQLMEGMSLAAILDLHAESGEHFTIPKVRSIVSRILTGLGAIHATGAIHGNLKPQNIFVLPERLVLSDPYYLVAEPLKEGQEIPVWDYYRGPEQLTDPALEMVQTDLFAAALIFGELVGGNPVRPGVPLSSQVPRLTARFDDWFVRATATDPLQRPSSLTEFRDSLSELLDVVESEGLWQRRYHETGSFRAVRVAAPREEAIRPVEEVPKTAPVVAPAAVEPPAPVEPPPAPAEAMVEEVSEEPVTEVVAEPEPEVVAEPEPEPVAVSAEEVVEPEVATAAEEPVTVAALEPEPETVEVEVPEDEGILVSPEPEPPEEAIEGIEVLPDEAPPIPAEAAAGEGLALSRPTEAFLPDESLRGPPEVPAAAATVEAPPIPSPPPIKPLKNSAKLTGPS